MEVTLCFLPLQGEVLYNIQEVGVEGLGEEKEKH